MSCLEILRQNFHLLKNMFLVSPVGPKGNRFHSWTHLSMFSRVEKPNGRIPRTTVSPPFHFRGMILAQAVQLKRERSTASRREVAQEAKLAAASSKGGSVLSGPGRRIRKQGSARNVLTAVGLDFETLTCWEINGFSTRPPHFHSQGALF